MTAIYLAGPPSMMHEAAELAEMPGSHILDHCLDGARKTPDFIDLAGGGGLWILYDGGACENIPELVYYEWIRKTYPEEELPMPVVVFGPNAGEIDCEQLRLFQVETEHLCDLLDTREVTFAPEYEPWGRTG